MYCRFFLRFYVDIRVNLGLQFVIGILILVGLVGLSYPKPIPLKKKKKKKSPNQKHVLVGSVGSYMIVQSYTILHDPTYNPTIFTILLQF